MNLAELKQSLIDKKLDNVYIFTGDEIKVMNIYINQIAKVLGRTVQRKETVGEIFKTLKISTITNNESVYVILDDMDFLKQEKHWEQLMSSTEKHTIILIYSSFDKRSKFYKQYKDRICEFEKLHGKVLAKYIQKDVKLDSYRAERLSIMCDNSYNLILMEVDKLKNLMQVYDITADQAFDKMVEENLIYTKETEFVFSIADAFCKRQTEKLLMLIHELDVSKDSPIAILSLIYTNIKAMLLVNVCPKSQNVSETTGLTGWQIKTAMEKGYNYSPQELLGIMDCIRFIDDSIKIGKIEPQNALQYLVCEVM